MDLKKYISEGHKCLEKLKTDCITGASIAEKLLLELIDQNKNTEFGRKYGFSEIKSIEDYKKMVPFTEYSHYYKFINRMQKGEKDLITTEKIVHYAKTSGSIGVPKKIPVSEAALKCLDDYCIKMYAALMDDYLLEHENRHLYNGQILTTVVAKITEARSGETVGALSSGYYNLIREDMEGIWAVPDFAIYVNEESDHYFVKALFGLKNRDVICLDAPFASAVNDFLCYIKRNREMLCDAVEKGQVPEGISLGDTVRPKIVECLKPDPIRAGELRAAFANGFDEPIIRKIWPHFEYVNCIGAGGFSAYVEKIREYIGDIPISYYSYASSEALIATATKINVPEYTLLPRSGFFEFIPVEDSERSPGELQERTLNMDQLEAGRDYEIIVTNLSGFYRYRIGDVVTVHGYSGQCPLISFKYRTSQTISMAGEKTTMLCITDAVEYLKKKMGIVIPEYSVFPDYRADTGRYYLFMESDGDVPEEEYEAVARLLDEKLSKDNPSYGDKLKSGILGPLEIGFVQPDTYMLYRDLMIYKGTSENQVKPVRVIDNAFKEKFFFGLLKQEEINNEL